MAFWKNPTPQGQDESTRRAFEAMGKYSTHTLDYQKITAAAASVTLTLPKNHTYDTIEWALNITASGADSGVHVQINGDTAANYYCRIIFSLNAGAPTAFGEGAVATGMRCGVMGSTRASAFKGTIPDVRDIATNKTLAYNGGGYISANQQIESGFSLWVGTGAISTLKFIPDANNFAAGSSFHVYGIL